MAAAQCFHIPVPSGFCLQKAVCSYGFFMMAPNMWTPPQPGDSARPGATLARPLRLADGRSAMVIISMPQQCRRLGAPGCARLASEPSPCDHCACHIGDLADDEPAVQLEASVWGVNGLSSSDKVVLEAQIVRMLRLDPGEEAAIQGFHALHLKAKEENFGRLFRSPSLFEDMVKTLLLCNCGWGRTLSMARKLCELQAELEGLPLGYLQATERKAMGPASNRAAHQAQVSGENGSGEILTPGEATKHHLNYMGQSASEPILGAFPTAAELARLDASVLSKRCRLGYRATRLLQFAKSVHSGELDLQALQCLAGQPVLPLPELKQKILQVPGFGPFSTANVMQCLGDYTNIPADSETVRHLQQVRGMKHCTLTNVETLAKEAYSNFAPYQFLAYWWELWAEYERCFGPLSSMAQSEFGRITGHNMRCSKGKPITDSRSVIVEVVTGHEPQEGAGPRVLRAATRVASKDKVLLVPATGVTEGACRQAASADHNSVSESKTTTRLASLRRRVSQASSASAKRKLDFDLSNASWTPPATEAAHSIPM
eukprot:SM000163S02321  [mRNA]  locus=s163:305977:308513:+ [translate_table: standard]